MMFENPLAIPWTMWVETCDIFMDTDFATWGCEYYCQKWNIAKAKPLFDMDPSKLRKLIDYLFKYRAIMHTPSKNIFNIDAIRLEYAIDKFYGKR